MSRKILLIGVIPAISLFLFLNFTTLTLFEITNPPAPLPNVDPLQQPCSTPQNGVSWTQVPHDLPGFPNYFVGRAPADGEGCKDNGKGKWKLVIAEMDWETKQLKIVNSELLNITGSQTVQNGTIPITTAYDPSLLFAYGKLWVAFECGAKIRGVLLTSACMGPIDTSGDVSKWTVNLPQTTVIATSNTYGNINASVSVPKLFFWKGLPYLYYSDVHVNKYTTKWEGSSVRGAMLYYDGTNFWAKGSIGEPMDSVDPKLNWAVFRRDRFDPSSDQFADAFSVVVVGPPGDETKIFLLGALGGSNGDTTFTQKADGTCVIPSGGFYSTSRGCYRSVIASADRPLGDAIFNVARVQNWKILKQNPVQYLANIRTETNDSFLMGSYSCDGGSATAQQNWKPKQTCNAGDLWRSMAFPLDFVNLQTIETSRTFKPGKFSMVPGGSLIVGDGRVEYQTDGNLVLYNYFKKAIWATGSSKANSCSPTTCRAVFDNGDLVLYRNGGVYWTSSSWTHGDGVNLTFRISAGRPHFEITKVDEEVLMNENPSKTYFTGKLKMSPGQAIATAGEGTLRYQSEGNLVLYDSYGKAIWVTPINEEGYCVGHTCLATFQKDGNLVLYRDDAPYWASNTNGKGYHLVISATQGETPLQILDTRLNPIFK